MTNNVKKIFLHSLKGTEFLKNMLNAEKYAESFTRQTEVQQTRTIDWHTDLKVTLLCAL